jgi:quercetin dioxygenase-like cupin family protein
LHFERIAEPLVNPRMEGFVVTVAPGGKSGADVPIRYRGEEVVFGLEGCVRFVVRGEEYVVGPGDTLHLKGNVPHTWENAGAGTARMLMVCAFAYDRG